MAGDSAAGRSRPAYHPSGQNHVGGSHLRSGTQPGAHDVGRADLARKAEVRRSAPSSWCVLCR
jgi:hypothetical protein